MAIFYPQILNKNNSTLICEQNFSSKEQKLLNRKHKNRISAQRLRLRKKEYVLSLEKTVSSLRSQNSSLKKEIAAHIKSNTARIDKLDKKNEIIMLENEKLKREISVLRKKSL